MFSGGTGRTISIVNNVIATLLTIYLLYSYDAVIFAALIAVFALSVSVTQCKTRLPITFPVLLINAVLLLAGLGYCLFRYFFSYISETETTMLGVVILISINTAINLLIIRELHYNDVQSNPVS